MVCGVSKKVYSFGDLWNKKSVVDVKTKMSICQSKANLDVKI